jgi:hypothetical protein
MAFSGALVALFLWSALARGAAFEVRDTTWEGCSALLDLARDELGPGRAVPVSHLDWSDLRPEDALLLLHPDHALSGDKLAAFLGKGGRVAVVDDFGAGDQILARFQIERVPPPSRPASMLRRNPQLAVAEPVREPTDRGGAVHITVQDVDRLVTNHPTGLRNPKLTPVLKIPSVGEPDVLLALAGNFGTPPRGKLFAMGDPSALTNQMLRYPGNRAFAVGLIRYLSQASAGRVFIIANHFGESGAYATLDGWQSEVSDRLESAQQWLARVASEGFAGVAGLGFSALLAFAVGVWTTSVSSRPYRRRVPSFARPVPLVAQGGVAGRAAVLAAPSTPRGLAVLELKSALEDGISHELGHGKTLTLSQLVDELGKADRLDEKRRRELQRLALEMSNIETAALAGRADKVTKADVRRISRVVFDLLAAVHQRGRAPSRAA